ncbi:MAG TPA: DUF1549 and DUF1553 domain-containing protein, partial [Armatimonadota bacterium]|nr:DUF1549 and DUF1553 domain-containing protein [Armatimonadota bacterium]
AAMSVTVQDVDTPSQWSFANEIVPVFTKAGCNVGGCHGSPSGRGGFRLSLFGYEPDYDYDMVTKDRNGSRINRNQPSLSLVLQKPAGEVPHGGGTRFKKGSEFYNRILDWLKAGAPKQPEFDPRVARVEIFPKEWVLDKPGQAQQILVMAVRDDGTTQDVTEYARYNSNDDQVAEVDEDGKMTAAKPGETAIMIRYLNGVGVVNVRVPRAPLPAAAFAGFKPVNYIDQLVLEKLRDVRIPPSGLANDSEFLRRAYIDTCGLTPTVEEAKQFLDDRSPDKREKLVDQLLNRPEFVDYWTLRFSDLLRNNQQVKQDKGLQVFYRWIRDSVRDNKPWDQMARELILSSGSGYRNGPVNWYNIGDVGQDYPLFLASATSQVFLGVRMDCARCHNHPFEAWSQMDYYSLAAFFARTRMKNGPDENEKIFFSSADGEVYHPRRDRSRPDAVIPAKLLGGNVVTFAPDEDRREKLADWITSPANPWFKRSIANRIWNNFFGRGIVQPVDDYRLTNPAANEKLLDTLGEKVVAYKFNLKALMRDILLSRTYQTSSQPVKENQDDRLYASHALPRRLYAEVLLDAITTATDVPEKFGPYEYGRRAVSVPDNRVPNGFLDLFGRARRENACECERTEETNVSMVLNLVNGSTLNDRLRNPSGRVARAVAAKKGAKEIIEEFYLAALSRRPTAREVTLAEQLMAKAPSPQEGAEDLMWGLLNMKEFMFNH